MKCDIVWQGGRGILNFVTSHFKNDVDTMNVSDINSPNENDGTTMPVINDIKQWIRSPWTQDA